MGAVGAQFAVISLFDRGPLFDMALVLFGWVMTVEL